MWFRLLFCSTFNFNKSIMVFIFLFFKKRNIIHIMMFNYLFLRKYFCICQNMVFLTIFNRNNCITPQSLLWFLCTSYQNTVESLTALNKISYFFFTVLRFLQFFLIWRTTFFLITRFINLQKFICLFRGQPVKKINLAPF